MSRRQNRTVNHRIRIGAAVGLLCLAVSGGSASALEVGATVPAWKLTGPEGKSWTSDALRGQVVVLEFWATWCTTCGTHMPDVARLGRDYADRPVQVIAVNIRENGDPVAYMREKGAGIDYALDGDAVAERLAVAGTPTAVVIDGDGRLAFQVTGAGEMRTKQLRATLDRLLTATD